MFISQRDYNLRKNQILGNLDQDFPILRRMDRIFEIFFTEDGCNIIEGCDGNFFEKLSSNDLRQLSNYFLEISKICD